MAEGRLKKKRKGASVSNARSKDSFCRQRKTATYSLTCLTNFAIQGWPTYLCMQRDKPANAAHSSQDACRSLSYDSSRRTRYGSWVGTATRESGVPCMNSPQQHRLSICPLNAQASESTSKPRGQRYRPDRFISSSASRSGLLERCCRYVDVLEIM